MAIAKTTEQFIKEAHEVHGNKYDYSKSVYVRNDVNVIIKCIKHQFEFPQRPASHLKGQGCPKCGREKLVESNKISLEEFITRSKKKHGNKYDYSKVVLEGVDNDVIIICPIHDEFPQRPAGHMRGSGCDKCAALKRGRKRRNSLEKILSQFKEAHGDLYDYSEVDYQGVDTYVIIRCIKHDWKFPQTPYKHTQGSGCKFCKAEALRAQHIKNFDEFKKDALKAHGKKFDYSRVDYKGAKKNIEIGCPTKAHGYFMQTPDHHINGVQGCPICAEEVRSLGYTIEHIKKENIKINGFLYVINAFNDDENFFKIGITTKSTSWRFRGKSDMPYDYEILCEIDIGLVQAYEHEQYILNKYQKYKYIPKIYFPGKDEVLSINPLEHDERLKELYLEQKDLIDDENI